MKQQELQEKLAAMVGTIQLRKADFVRQSSGLVLVDVLSFQYKVSEFLPLVGREYKQLPTFLAKKYPIVNVQNTDNRCLGYAIASARANIVENPQRTGHYNHHLHTFKLDQIQYPVEVLDICQLMTRWRWVVNILIL